MPNFNGVVEIQESGGGGATTVVLNGDNGDVTVGGNGQDGQLLVANGAGVARFSVDAATGTVTINAADGDPLLTVDGPSGDIVVFRKISGTNRKILEFNASGAELFVGGDGNEGDVGVRDSANNQRIRLDGGLGDIVIKDANNNTILHFDSSNAGLFVGGQNNEGDVVVRDAANKERIKLDAGEGDITVRNVPGNAILHFDSANAGLFVGGQGNEGDVVVRDGANRQRVKLDGGEGDIWVKDEKGNLLLHFDSANAGLFVGGNGNEGDVVVRDGANRERIKLDGAEGDIIVRDINGVPWFHFDSEFAALFLGGRGNEGDLVVRDEANRERIKLDGGEGDIIVRDTANNVLLHFDTEFAALFVGGVGNEGDVVVRNGDGNQTIKLDGGQGDIILNNADAAEDFAVARAEDAAPGMVMVLADDGTLEPCSQAYDRKVVGVVSGAGQYKPGLVFDRGATKDPLRAPISMMGKVACRADASYGRIEIGDLLTTSPRTGCAMKAADPARAFGAVIGKAMSPLDDGEGLVTMLISLQ